MAPHVEPSTEPTAAPDACVPDAKPRPCVACGYDLRGLGEEPRCPECGLVNVPQGYREQVWQLIDSHWWAFSNVLNPFARRPAGWWWALDRPGDVRRSFVFAAVCVLVMAVLVLGGALLDDAVRARHTSELLYHHPDDDPLAAPRVAGHYEDTYGAIGGESASNEVWSDNGDLKQLGRRARRWWQTRWDVVLAWPSARILEYAAWAAVYAFWVWAGPALAGIWTQIRKGLPDFARAPRTIIAASNYETHRLVYLGLLALAGWLLDAVLRVTLLKHSPQVYLLPLVVVILSLAALPWLGWIGPLRSDYTRQLIRSRLHALRVFLMYVVFLPGLMTAMTLLPFYHGHYFWKYWSGG